MKRWGRKKWGGNAGANGGAEPKNAMYGVLPRDMNLKVPMLYDLTYNK